MLLKTLNRPRISRRPLIRIAFAALVVIFYGALTLYTTRPIYRQLTDSTLIQPGDGILTAYFIRWDQHQLSRAPLKIFDAPFYYPQKNSLALSENLIGLAILLWPLKFFKDTLLLANAAILVSFWTLALAAYWVFRKWTGSRWLGLIAGIYIGFAAPRFPQTTHLQLLSYQPTLLSIYFVERWLRTLNGRDACFFWGTLLVQYYIGIYLFEFNLLVLTAMFPVLLLARRRVIRWNALLRQTVTGGLCCAALMWPVYTHYARMRDTLPGGNPLELLRDTGATLTDYLKVTGFNAVWRDQGMRWRNTYSPFPWEHEMGLVYSTWILLFIGITFAVWRVWRRPQAILPGRRGLYLALILASVLCIALSFGPVLHFSARTINWPLYGWFFNYFPGFNGMRVPSRFIFPISVLIPCLALLPIAPLWRWLGSKSSLLKHVAGAGLLMLSLLEHRTMPLMLFTMPKKDELPAVIKELRHRQPGPVFFWPTGLEKDYEYYYLYYNSYFWFPMVNGRSGYLPRPVGELFNFLEAKFPDPEAIKKLRSIGVRYIVHAGHLEEDATQRGAVRAKLDQLAAEGQLKQIYADPLDAAYKFR